MLARQRPATVKLHGIPQPRPTRRSTRIRARLRGELVVMRTILVLPCLLGMFSVSCTSCTPAAPSQPIDHAMVPGTSPDTRPAIANLPVPRRAADGSFPAHLQWDDRTLQCNGAGLCEWGIFGIDLYVATLYSERRVPDLASALEPPQRTVIHLHFVRGLTREQLSEAYTASVRANTGDQFAAYEPALRQLLDTMQGVRIDDSYTFCSAPDQGLTIYHNDRRVGQVADEPFRRLFLQLYLGDQPPTKALRDALLAKK